MVGAPPPPSKSLKAHPPSYLVHMPNLNVDTECDDAVNTTIVDNSILAAPEILNSLFGGIGDSK